VTRKVILVVMLFVIVSSCSMFRNNTDTANRTGQAKDGSNAAFYSFPDIPLPRELSLIREKSFIYEAPGMKVGVLLLSGNVDMESLENYFRANMAKNGWRFVNSYKYNDMILNFVKEDRASNIRITRETFTTHVEVWVGPVEKSGRGTPTMGSRANDSR
jgi:hypothetical protein